MKHKHDWTVYAGYILKCGTCGRKVIVAKRPPKRNGCSRSNVGRPPIERTTELMLKGV